MALLSIPAWVRESIPADGGNKLPQCSAASRIERIGGEFTQPSDKRLSKTVSPNVYYSDHLSAFVCRTKSSHISEKMSSFELLCAEACPEVLPVAGVDGALLSDSRILERLLRLELSVDDYFSSDSQQKELQPYMRRVVTTWMLEVCEEQSCEEQVFPLAVTLLDRFLSESPVKRCHLQLLGCVCLLTASKLRQCRPIGVDLLVYYTDHSVTAQEIRVWEMLLLAKLKWDVCSVTAFDFVDHLLERLPLCHRRTSAKSVTSNPTAMKVRAHALTYVTLCYTEMEFVTVKPSMIAAASVSAALCGMSLSTIDSAQHDTLAHLVNANTQEFTSLVLNMQKLMSAQLSSTQQQQQPNNPSSNTNSSSSSSQVQQQPSKSKMKQTTTTTTTTTTSGWESDVQPETPTDVQDIHF